MSPTLGLALTLVLALTNPARDDRPADPLLALAPPDAGLTLVVEGFRDRSRAFLRSPTLVALRALPAVREGMASPEFRKLQVSRREVEAAIGLDFAAIRDEILGDAVVLAMQGPPETARGLMLVRPRDPARLRSLVDGLNRAEGKNLVGPEAVDRQGVTYWHRRFRDDSKPDEWYAWIGDEAFAWSNSEALVQEAIDRHEGRLRDGGLAGVAAFGLARGAEGPGAIAGLFVDPRFLERALQTDLDAKSEEERRTIRLLLDRLGAVRYAGLTFAWRDGVVLQMRQILDPSRASEGLRAWADRPAGADARPAGIADSALAFAVADLDLAYLLDGLKTFVPPGDRPRLDLLGEIARGAWPDRDFRREILPRLGPTLFAVVHRPETSESPWPWTIALALKAGDDPSEPALARSIAGALRAGLAWFALQAPPGAVPGRIVTRTVGGVVVTGLEGTRRGFAFAVEADRVVVGPSVDVVARGLGREGDGGLAFRGRRRARFPSSTSYAYADLVGLREALQGRRDRIIAGLKARRGSDAARDLDQVLALMGLFRFGYATAAIGPGAESLDYEVGLVTAEGDPSR